MQGPALIHPDGSVEYSLYGERLTEDEFNKRMKRSSLWREVLAYEEVSVGNRVRFPGKFTIWKVINIENGIATLRVERNTKDPKYNSRFTIPDEKHPVNDLTIVSEK
jgi:hypothetical protein